MNKHLRIWILSLLVLSATKVNASNVDWNAALPLSIDGGPESPLVLFGFNPQPEPPPLVLTTTPVYDPAAAELQLSGIQPTPFRGVPFQVYLAAQGGRFGALPTIDPAVPFSEVVVPFTTTGGNALNFLLSFAPGGLAAPGSELFFNPQPEPPALFDSEFGLQFVHASLANIDTVAVRLQVFDAAGNALGISPVPVPAAVWLFGSALLGLIGVARRKSAA